MADYSEQEPAWPSLVIEDWQPTRDTFILWLQIIGKVTIARTPLLNHWWNAPFQVTSTGITTGLIPDRPGRSFSIDLDLEKHRLDVRTTRGFDARMDLGPMSVKAFYAEFEDLLNRLDLATPIWPMPVELEGAIPFTEDDVHHAYDPNAIETFWRMLIEIQQVFETFRAGFLGKSSPVHLFWGALDLAVTRFSGRTAPPHPGGAPNCGPHVMHEAYSHEVCSAGYWPGGEGEGLFYSYTYPEPEGYRKAFVDPLQAGYDAKLGEFVLPYKTVRTAPDPDAVLLEFLQTSYQAAADLGGWDRTALERQPSGEG